MSSRCFFRDRKSTRLNSSHVRISYAVFFLKKKKLRRRKPISEIGAEGLGRRLFQAHLTPPSASRDGRAARCRRHSPRQSRARFFFFNDTATTEIYTLSLHDALPI